MTLQTASGVTPTSRPGLDVSVLMRRERLHGNPWQDWRWRLHDVLPASTHVEDGAVGGAAPAPGPRRLEHTPSGELWLHTGLRVELYRDDAQGYVLNATSPAPCWFVLWRMQELPALVSLTSEPIAVPEIVTLSYHDAGRWLDAQETVEQVPAPAEVVQWMHAFALAWDTPEPKRRQRPQSFQTLQDRFGNPASVSSGKP